LNILKHVILIPVYNDWKSLNKLLTEIDRCLAGDNSLETEILVINDKSTQKTYIEDRKYSSLKKIQILTLKKNLGSQKCIAIGLKYLKKSKINCVITVMDADGEDNPLQIKEMLNSALKYEDYIITSNRKKREESLLIIFFYKIHLIVSFLFTFKWISFGNFTTFNSKNLESLLSNNSSWYAHSSSVLKNCKIKRLYAKREKRYFDKSKLSLLSLIEHSLRVNSIFFTRIFSISILYTTFIFSLNFYFLNYLIILPILMFNIFLIFIKIKHYIKDLDKLEEFIGDTKLI
jgi:polyisoprenyl-phosphate glycosyltransferase